MKLFLIKNENGTLSPAYDSDREQLEKHKINEIREYQSKGIRNVKFHRKFFALINMVFSNQDVYKNIDHLRSDLIVAAGFYDVTYDFHGTEVLRPKSISFASMDQDEFENLYSRVLDAVLDIYQWDEQTIIDNIYNFF